MKLIKDNDNQEVFGYFSNEVTSEQITEWVKNNLQKFRLNMKLNFNITLYHSSLNFDWIEITEKSQGLVYYLEINDIVVEDIDDKRPEYIISRTGINNFFRTYVIERADGSELLNMQFDTEKRAITYANIKGLKIKK